MTDNDKRESNRPFKIDDSALSFMNENDRVEIIEAASKLRVSEKGTRLHKDISEHKEKCERWSNQRKSNSYRYERQTGEMPLFADKMSPKTYSRAFRILDAILKGMIPFGASVTQDFLFQVNGENVPFTISEAQDKIPHEMTTEEKMQLLRYEEDKRNHFWASKPNIPKWDHPWNGKLSLIIDMKYKFRDCTSYILEDRVGEILIAFYEASYDVRLKRLEREEKERIEKENRRKREEIRERYNQEVDNTEGLVNEANDYETACRIRQYVAAVKASGCKNTDWIEWASAKAGWYDPTIHADDPYFGVRKHEQKNEYKDPGKKYYDW